MFVVEREIGGRKLRIETGKIAKQASGAAVVTCGDTIVLAAATDQQVREGFDFFPLTVDYREKGSAAGLIFGGRFNKREGRPTEKEILTMRLIDRPIRPLWPENYSQDILIQSMVLSADPDVEPDVLAMIASSAALALSPLPFLGPVGSVRVGMLDGKYVLNPPPADLEKSSLDMVISGTKDAILMVEAGATEVSNEAVIGAIEFARGAIREIALMQEELARAAGKPKIPEPPPPGREVYELLLKNHLEDAKRAAWTEGKFGRREALKKLADELVAKYAMREGEVPGTRPTEADIRAAFEKLQETAIRRQILEGRRCDGRGRDDIRPIEIEVGVLPRVHGSALFTRGETQAIVSVTLGTVQDEQLVESLRGEFAEKFLLHYNFPSFCVGEVKMPRGPGRREIGHGALAKRAIMPVLPEYEKFPYTIRVVSDILESNGSSSMASVCGATMALMDAGVPISAPVAGIAMGLVIENGQTCVVTDILGDEDHYGDMDFKVAGTARGITALQMDIKVSGISTAIMAEALAKAEAARLRVLEKMASVMAAPRSNISEHAPKIIQMRIPVDKIGKLIGPGGKTIRGLEQQFGVTIDVDDEGCVVVASPKRDKAEEAARYIENMCAVPEIGKVYMGEVVNIRDFGVFFEILPGVEGMCHVSELDTSYVKDPNEFCRIGDRMEVKLISIDEQGRLKLSRKAVLNPSWEPPPPPESGRGGRDSGRRRDDGGRARERDGAQDGRPGGVGAGGEEAKRKGVLPPEEELKPHRSAVEREEEREDRRKRRRRR
ncbi:MAG: polyribonucleotide nucleotidyltransferase [Planctomycetota bacterium]|nr:polyribonucleotide nucleotidyltransferase [Planctomycetota bacterium]